MIIDVNIKKNLLRSLGFTLVELMVAVAIVAILATITMPSYLQQRQRNDVAEAIRLAKNIRDDVSGYYSTKLSFPSDNKEAGVPEPELLIGNKILRMEIEDGAIHITLGNKVSQPLQNKIVSLRPAIVTGSPASPISWLCGSETPVSGMEAVGNNKTDISDGLIPASCSN